MNIHIKNLAITILAGAAGVCAARLVKNLFSSEEEQVPVTEALGFFTGSLVAEMTATARTVAERLILDNGNHRLGDEG